MKILFVCTRNLARGPMAAAILLAQAGDGNRYAARSAGVAPQAPRLLTTRELAWADVVAVMGPEHLALIQRHWPDHTSKVRVLGVPDDYEPGEPELREVLTAKIRVLLGELGASCP